MSQTRREFLQLTAAGAIALSPELAFTHVQEGSIDSGSETALELLRAAISGDLDTVRKLLETAPSLLATKDEQGLTLYALASRNGHRDIASHLAERGYLSDAHEAALAGDWDRFAAMTENDWSHTNQNHPIGGGAMYAAALGGAGADIWRVYAANGDPNAAPQGALGASPLQAALRYRDLEIAELTAASLLGNNADPNPANGAEEPPLSIAAERGSYEMVEMLIRHGARPQDRNSHRRTAQSEAERAGHRAVAELLANHHEVPRTHSTSRTAYDASGRPYSAPDIEHLPITERHRLVGQSHGNLDYVKEALVRNELLVHSVTTNGEICVEACAHTGRKAVVDHLLAHGAPYSLPTAVMRNDLVRVRELLDEDPLRIHERGAHDFALLWYPIIGKTGAEMLELLLGRGAKVEEQHYLGTTALHWAAMRGPIEVVDLLLAHGADPNRRGRKFGADGETPLEAAVRREQDEIARLLRDRGAIAPA